MSNTLYACISIIEDLTSVIFSLYINCSPTINVPVVSDTFNSFEPLVLGVSAKYPIAPLDSPLTLAPFTCVVSIFDTSKVV